MREASSRHPSRFLGLLSNHWAEIPESFRDDVMSGVSTYLAHRYGNLKTDETWKPLEEPDASLLASQILDELERHPMYWRHRRSTAKALEACSHVIHDPLKAERLIFLAIDFVRFYEGDPIKGDSVGLLDLGLNMAKGAVAEALMILVDNFLAQDNEFPELLAPTLRRFASDKHPAVRAMILRRLPYLQSKSFDFGWDLFHLAMQDAGGLWQIAERSLYYAYHRHFDVVKPLLVRLRCKGRGKDLETWGRISALAAMTRHFEFDEFLNDLNTLDNAEAWHGATTVWINAENMRQHREQCFAGIKAGLNAGGRHALEVACEMTRIFHYKGEAIFVPIGLISRCFSVFENDNDGEKKHPRFFGFHEWLNVISLRDPEHALAATEIYLTYISHSKQRLYDHNDNLTQLMTRLFMEAEEREESDRGSMLQRVVAIQDTLLSLGVKGIADWLKAAERP